MSTAVSTRRGPYRILGLITVVVFLGLVARFWNPVYGFTSFIQLDSSNESLKIAAFREHPVFVHRDTGGYDGLYYSQIAYDPLLKSAELAPAIDSLPYRARRILPSALAWTLAVGNPAAIVHVYSLLNVVAWLGLAFILWRLLVVDSARSWLAWAGVLFSAGALCSVRLALTDLVALTILAAALLAAERERRGWAAGALAAAGLARETSLIVLTGLVTRPWWSWGNLARAVVAVAPLAAWMLYVQWRVGATPDGLYNFSWPGSVFVWKWQSLVHAWQHEPDRLLMWTTVLATVGLTAQAAFFLIHRQPGDRWWRIGLGYTAMLLFLGQPVWDGFPGAATRVLLPLNLAFNVRSLRSRASLGWLLVGNLTIFAGLLALGSVPHDHRELAEVRSGGTACVARLDQGWYSVEAKGRHTWAWSDASSRIELVTWGHRDQPVEFKFTLRSLTPRTLAIRDDRGELWHGAIGPQKVEVTLNSRLTSGRGRLFFYTPEPAVREPSGRGGRALAFALYDGQLLLPEP